MSKTIVDVLNALCEKLGMAVDWTSDNIMPYLNDLITRYSSYKFTMSVIYVSFAVGLMILIGFSCLLCVLHIRKKYGEGWKQSDQAIVCLIIGIICFVVGVFTILYNLDIMITSKFIPEKLIMDYITNEL